MTDREPGEQSGSVESVLRALPTQDTQTALLGRLYRDHADFVWRVLLRFGIPEAIAEDVAHEVFLVVGRRLDRYDGSTPFKAWLYGVARGVAANVRRSQARSQQRLRVVDPPADPDTPEQEVARSQAASLVARFLDTLKPRSGRSSC